MGSYAPRGILDHLDARAVRNSEKATNTVKRSRIVASSTAVASKRPAVGVLTNVQHMASIAVAKSGAWRATRRSITRQSGDPSVDRMRITYAGILRFLVEPVRTLIVKHRTIQKIREELKRAALSRDMLQTDALPAGGSPRMNEAQLNELVDLLAIMLSDKASKDITNAQFMRHLLVSDANSVLGSMKAAILMLVCMKAGDAAVLLDRAHCIASCARSGNDAVRQLCLDIRKPVSILLGAETPAEEAALFCRFDRALMWATGSSRCGMKRRYVNANDGPRGTVREWAAGDVNAPRALPKRHPKIGTCPAMQ